MRGGLGFEGIQNIFTFSIDYKDCKVMFVLYGGGGIYLNILEGDQGK